MKTIIKGHFTEGEPVTVNIDGTEFTRKVRWNAQAHDLCIVVKNQYYFFCEFDFAENWKG